MRARILPAIILLGCVGCAADFSSSPEWGARSTPAAPPLMAPFVSIRPSAGGPPRLSRAPEYLPPRFRGRCITCRPVILREKIIALTFDDGPNPNVTPVVLATLQRYRARATFFVLGQFARQWPELLTMEARAGHAVESHSYSHPQLNVSPEHAAGELDRTQAVITLYTGRVPTLFRPPYGRLRNNLTRVALQRGKAVVLWTICGYDGPRMTAADIVERVTRHPRPGDIVLLHDGRDRFETARALPEILRRLHNRGFRFVTVPELLQRWDEALKARERSGARLYLPPHRQRNEHVKASPLRSS